MIAVTFNPNEFLEVFGFDEPLAFFVKEFDFEGDEVFGGRVGFGSVKIMNIAFGQKLGAVVRTTQVQILNATVTRERIWYGNKRDGSLKIMNIAFGRKLGAVVSTTQFQILNATVTRERI